MSINKDIDIDDGSRKTCIDLKWLFCIATLSVPVTHASTPSEQYHSLKNNLSQLFTLKVMMNLKLQVCRS